MSFGFPQYPLILFHFSFPLTICIHMRATEATPKKRICKDQSCELSSLSMGGSTKYCKNLSRQKRGGTNGGPKISVVRTIFEGSAIGMFRKCKAPQLKGSELGRFRNLRVRNSKVPQLEGDILGRPSAPPTYCRCSGMIHKASQRASTLADRNGRRGRWP